MKITVSYEVTRRILCGILAGVMTAGLLAEAWIATIGDGRSGLVSQFFSLSYEQNLPTWLSSSLLFSCAVLLSLIASSERPGTPFRAHWWGLAAAFFYISLDELAAIHEILNSRLTFGGILYFGWVVPATGVVIALGLLYLRFLRNLPGGVRRQFIVAGAIYVGGALGTEFLLGYWTSLAGDDNFVYALIDLCQESMELVGMTLFLLSLVRLLAASGGGVQIAVTSGDSIPSSVEPLPLPLTSFSASPRQQQARI
jgi:hypothetical protein